MKIGNLSSKRRHVPSLLLPAVTAAVAIVLMAFGGSPVTRAVLLAEQTAKPSGTVAIAELEPDYLIPGNAQLAYDEMHALFAPLTKVNDKGKLVMVQAESVTSNDEKTWTIKIKPGWTFDNGEPVTAQSYVDAINATAYAPNAWGNNGELNEIAGYSELNPASGTPATDKLSGLTVVNTDEFQVTLTSPDSQFPLELAGDLAYEPLPKVAYQNLTQYNLDPVGDGPFEMVQPWQRNVQLALKAYPGYQGSDKPKVENLTFKIYSDIDTALTDMQAGNVDITNIGQNLYGKAKEDFPNGFIAFNAPAIDYLGFPIYDPRFKNIKVREAFSMAINREAINKALFDGVLTPATNITPPSEQGSPINVCPYCKYDPQEARKLLAEAGGWSGPLVITYPSGAGYDQTFEAIGNELRQNLGVQDVTYSTAPFPQFLQTVLDHKIQGPMRGHWGALYPSMQNTLESLYATGSQWEATTNYSSPEVDKLISDGNGASTPAKAESYYRQAEKVIMDNFPVAPLFFGKYVYAHDSHVSNVIIDTNQVELTDLTVASS
jgi:oligopeptide transport system substrate-binding protein